MRIWKIAPLLRQDLCFGVEKRGNDNFYCSTHHQRVIADFSFECRLLDRNICFGLLAHIVVDVAVIIRITQPKMHLFISFKNS